MLGGDQLNEPAIPPVRSLPPALDVNVILPDRLSVSHVLDMNQDIPPCRYSIALATGRRSRVRIEQDQRLPQDQAAAFGDRVHRLLAALHPQASVQCALDQFEDIVQQLPVGLSSDQIINAKNMVNHAVGLLNSNAPLENHHATTMANARLWPTGKEAPCPGIYREVDLPTIEQLPLSGCMDLLIKSMDGTISVYDYKTGAPPVGDTLIRYQKQVALYALALEQAWPGVVVSGYLITANGIEMVPAIDGIADLPQNALEVLKAGPIAPNECACAHSCAGCKYRPGCAGFRHWLVNAMPADMALVRSIQGQVTNINGDDVTIQAVNVNQTITNLAHQASLEVGQQVLVIQLRVDAQGAMRADEATQIYAWQQ